MTRILGNDRIEILKLATEGHKIPALALVYGYSARDIQQLLIYQRGADVQTYKIGPELAAEVRDRAGRGESIGSIAASLNVHRNTIGRIVSGKGWKA